MAEILTLASSPVQLVAAPSAGQIIVPLYLLSRSGAGTTPYDSFGAGYLHTPNGDFNCGGLSLMLASIPDPVTDADVDWGFFYAGGFDPVTPGALFVTASADPLNGDFEIALEVSYIILTAAAGP